MEVKILCACGTKYAFDVEPVAGQMPAPVQCPACSVDATAVANEYLRQALANRPASPRPSAQAVRVGPAPAVRVAAPANTQEPEGDSGPPRCARHTTEMAAAECCVCGKPICAECLEQFGFLCSVYCQELAQRKNVEVPVYKGQKKQVRARERHKDKRLMVTVAAVAIGLFGAWAWVRFVASKPRVVFALNSTKAQPFAEAQWVGSDQLLTLTSERLALHTASGAAVWSVNLKPDERIVKGARGRDVQVAGESVWVGTAARAVRCDLKTGQRKSDVNWPHPVEELHWSDTSLIAVGPENPPQQSITRLDLASGQMRTETLALNPRPAIGGLPGGPAFGGQEFDDDVGTSVMVLPSRSELLASGAGAVQLSSRLLERIVITPAQTRSSNKPSILDRDNLRASQSTAATEEFMRENAQVRSQDQSRYAVSLRRLFGAGALEWKSDVTGYAAVFPQKTFDVLIAGNTVYAFGRNNQKLWEAKLTHPIAMETVNNTDRAPAGPCLELGSRLYVFDLGTLTAFDAKTGKVEWRLPSVGISGIEPDQSGKLYVASTTASPESVALAKPLAAGGQARSSLLKVDAASGRILWQQDNLANSCMPSGKFVYATSERTTALDMFRAAVGDADVQRHFRVHRLDPGKGNPIWEYYRPGPPLATLPNGSRIVLHYPTQVSVLKFLPL